MNASGLPAPPPENLTITVDGNPAIFINQDGDTYQFTYTLDGNENGGSVGIVDVAGVMEVPMDEDTSFSIKRDVVLVVNHRNEVNTEILSPSDGETVSGWLPIDVSATYDTSPEVLELQQPEVRILKTELRHIGSEEAVVTTDVESPYTLWVNTTRYVNGPQQFKVITYDTLNRRGEANITLNIQNSSQPTATGNLVADGNMEIDGIDAWQAIYGANLSKISDETHLNGIQSLLMHSDNPDSWGGFRQNITGLRGGERLRFTAWGRLKNNYTAQLRWNIDDQWGGTITSQYVSSFGYFRRILFEFDNPPGNTELLLELIIRDTGEEGIVAGEGVTSVEAIIDDVVVRHVCFPVVEAPTNVQTEIHPSGEEVTISWDGTTDESVEFYGVYRKLKSQGESDYEKIGEVRVFQTSFTDDSFTDSPDDYDYKVAAIDAMGWESDGNLTEALGEISNVLQGDPPLLIKDRTATSLVVEKEPNATAYNVYADAIGSWYSPTAAEGSVCGITTWTDNLDGTVTLNYEMPENTWIVVTASNPCQEGPAGPASDGVERSDITSWISCGATQ